ncbi:MAG TPA: 3-oxoacyl-[acyl-carrier-protein] reductase [Candidatus Kapabacteria bacterium]|jgi:3-oxoacyl-[acyl-carrier protein] reductase|nr:3-oxoacyl-[acyl-carrier-protein] reductase [Candidatus Kapabacteria bacterium]HPP39211.1 3-oxoacyl-[acyl-carrier-protein] reductase [Candidatus Kapabacteria bacterium]HPU22710.1 3-oxoacyl-[acyl-carrier-protein] reductase [Candidatus Kapabacteria bacterium]
MQRFENKIVVVTGGCRGIGKAIAERFAREGAFVYALDYRIPDENEVFIEDAAIRDRIVPMQADVTSFDSVQKVVDEILAKSSRIDILVNNAGITRDNLLMRMSEEEWDAVLNTNLKGAFICTKVISRPMMSQRYGRIINIGSVVGTMGNAGQANYSASKAGMIGFTKSVARELASRNILVNLVAPGYVRTPMTDKLTDEQKNAFLVNIPLKRVAEPEDIAASVAFLASDDASYITGQVLHVNGGMLMD